MSSFPVNPGVSECTSMMMKSSLKPVSLLVAIWCMAAGAWADIGHRPSVRP